MLVSVRPNNKDHSGSNSAGQAVKVALTRNLHEDRESGPQMHGLSLALQQLVDAGKTNGLPTHADCERVLIGIRARLVPSDELAGVVSGAPVSRSFRRIRISSGG